MTQLTSSFFWQIILLLFLLAKNKNDGEKDLFKQQQWTALNVVCLILLVNAFRISEFYIATHVTNGSYLLKNSYLYLFYSFLTILIVSFFKFKKAKLHVLGIITDNIPRLVLIGIGTAAINYLLYIALSELTNLSLSTIIQQDIYKRNNYALYIFTAVLWGPVIEEIIYRGILYSPFRKKYGPVVAIIITTLIFSISHFGISIDSILIGICLGLLYEKTESIICTILAHGSYNLFWVITVLLHR
jgi:membrane protease YdiL (CAAX protease family)